MESHCFYHKVVVSGNSPIFGCHPKNWCHRQRKSEQNRWQSQITSQGCDLLKPLKYKTCLPEVSIWSKKIDYCVICIWPLCYLNGTFGILDGTNGHYLLHMGMGIRWLESFPNFLSTLTFNLWIIIFQLCKIVMLGFNRDPEHGMYPK